MTLAWLGPTFAAQVSLLTLAATIIGVLLLVAAALT